MIDYPKSWDGKKLKKGSDPYDEFFRLPSTGDMTEWFCVVRHTTQGVGLLTRCDIARDETSGSRDSSNLTVIAQLIFCTRKRHSCKKGSAARF